MHSDIVPLRSNDISYVTVMVTDLSLNSFDYFGCSGETGKTILRFLKKFTDSGPIKCQCAMYD